MAEQVVFHDHTDGRPCNAGCWTLADAPWDRPLRTERKPHTHIFQVEVPLRGDCPACDEIDPVHMKGKPYKTGRNSYDIAFNGGGWS